MVAYFGHKNAVIEALKGHVEARDAHARPNVTEGGDHETKMPLQPNGNVFHHTAIQSVSALFQHRTITGACPLTKKTRWPCQPPSPIMLLRPAVQTGACPGAFEPSQHPGSAARVTPALVAVGRGSLTPIRSVLQ